MPGGVHQRRNTLHVSISLNLKDVLECNHNLSWSAKQPGTYHTSVCHVCICSTLPPLGSEGEPAARPKALWATEVTHV